MKDTFTTFLKIFSKCLLLTTLIIQPFAVFAGFHQNYQTSAARAASGNLMAHNSTTPLSSRQSLSTYLKALEKKYQVHFLMESSLVNKKEINVAAEEENRSWEEQLRQQLQPFGLAYRKLADNSFVIVKEQQQATVSGRVSDENGEALIGATVAIKALGLGTITDIEGAYSLEVPAGSHQLTASYVGHKTVKKEINISEGQQLSMDFTLKASTLDEVVVLGNRSLPRSALESPVPVDNISASSLESTGQPVLDQQLMFKVPSYNSTQQPVSDAGAHFNPADLRGLLPSRTLVLVNGKRKNASALVYSYLTPGRGEVGVDMKSIPTAAIERVEVLRDGAAAQYGSDAVAGVINLVLKKAADPFVNTQYSITSRGDGQQFQFESGAGFNISDKGFANFSLSYFDQQSTQRAGDLDVDREAGVFGQAWTDFYNTEEGRNWVERNPKAGFQVGLPEMTISNFTYNTGYTLDESKKAEIYSFGSYMNRKGSAPQFARTPYWIPNFTDIYPGEDFFLAEMAPDISDYTFALGYRMKHNDWNFDFSSTFGGNMLNYYINNSFNAAYGPSSPSNFFNGSHQFRHTVNNIDISRTFRPENLYALTLAFGGEHRNENFIAKQGELASYDQGGSQSFSGIRPESETDANRSNAGVYSEVTVDFTESFLIGGAIRYENYSDFGDNLSWKLNSRYLFDKNLSVRFTVSNGFRAPSLHQIHYSAITTTLTSEGIKQQGTIDNLDPVLRALEVPRLQAESSFNLGGGFAYRINDHISLTADIYQIDVYDRIVLSGQVGKQTDAEGNELPEESAPVNEVLNNYNTESAQFFLNAVDTRTRGADIVLDIEQIAFGAGDLNFSLAANFNQTSVQAINLPDFITQNNLSDHVFDRRDISRLETFRPRQKVVGSVGYKINKLKVNFSGMYYGAVTWRHPTMPENDRTYRGKMLNDVNLIYRFNKNVALTLGVNNLFNIYPDQLDAGTDPNTDFAGRFRYPWETTQFGIDGTRMFVKTNITF
jgi:iron complex outermembrane receptor protein